MRVSGAWRWLLPSVLYLSAAGCSERTRVARPGSDGWFGAALPSAMPDERPRMLNDDLPFRYPVAQYRQQVQGNVLLRLFVDSAGHVIADSTRLLETSGQPALDSAALAGASLLRFRPAYRRGTAIPVSLVYPVHFRHPEGRALPGDSL